MKKLQLAYSNLKDIPYNFLVGDDGFMYEGRGYRFQGDLPENNLASSFEKIGIIVAFIGTFDDRQPSQRQIATFNEFLANSVQRDYLKKNYKIISQDQLVMLVPVAAGLLESLKLMNRFHPCEIFSKQKQCLVF